MKILIGKQLLISGRLCFFYYIKTLKCIISTTNLARIVIVNGLMVVMLFTIGCKDNVDDLEEQIADVENNDAQEPLSEDENGGVDNSDDNNDDDSSNDKKYKVDVSREWLYSIMYEHLDLLEYGLNCRVIDENYDQVENLNYTFFYYGPHSVGGSSFNDLGEVIHEDPSTLPTPVPGVYTVFASDKDDIINLQSEPYQVHGYYYDHGLITPFTVDSKQFEIRKDDAGIAYFQGSDDNALKTCTIKIGSEISSTGYNDFEMTVYWRMPLESGTYYVKNLERRDGYDRTIPGMDLYLDERTTSLSERNEYSNIDYRYSLLKENNNDDAYIKIDFNKIDELDYSKWVDENGDQRGDYVLGEIPQYGNRIDFNTPSVSIYFHNVIVTGYDSTIGENIERELNGTVIVSYF